MQIKIIMLALAALFYGFSNRLYGMDLPTKKAAKIALSTQLLFTISGNKPLETINLLIGEGADVNFKNESGRTPLIAAVMTNNPELVEFLLKHGADVNGMNSNGNTALFVAISEGKERVIPTLLSANADITIDAIGIIEHKIKDIERILSLLRKWKLDQ